MKDESGKSATGGHVKKILTVFVIAILLATGCQPSDNQIQTAIAKTQSVLPKATNTFSPTALPKATHTLEPTRTPMPTATEIIVIPADARASKYVGGNESPILPDGDPGKLSVVAVGKYHGSIVPLVVRNNTNKAVIRISVSAAARSADGSLLATGSDQMFNPNLVNPGEISFGYIFFENVPSFPDDVQFEFKITANDPTSTTFENIRDLEVIEQNKIDDRIVGMLKNSYDVLVNGPMGVDVMCFSEDGEILAHYSDFTAEDQVEPNGMIPFQVSIYDGKPCPIFIVAAFGFE